MGQHSGTLVFIVIGEMDSIWSPLCLIGCGDGATLDEYFWSLEKQMHLQKCQFYKIYLSQESFCGDEREGHVIFIPEDNIQEIGIF